MFRTKLEVDRHVQNCLKNINNETERNLRCCSFAKLYFKVGDYEQARRYVSTYLSAKPVSAEGLNLLGQTLEKQGKLEAAIDAYQKSLDIDPRQNKLVIKLCELMASEDVGLDACSARYFCEKAQSFDPHNPIVFSLKERLIAAETHNPDDVTKLLVTELVSRPTDVHLRVRLLRHLLQNNRIKEAYKHASDIEQKNLPVFLNNLKWYETVAEVLVRYQRDNSTSTTSNLTWEFWMLLVSVLDKLVALTLDEHSTNYAKNAGTECFTVVFNFDQTLGIAAKNVSGCNEQPFVEEFLNHYRAQLCFHLVTLLFKQAKRDLITYKEAMNMVLPLLFAAFHSQPADLHRMWLDHCPEVRRQQIQRWHREAAFRCSQTGHVIMNAAKDRMTTIAERATQSCSGLWREQLFKNLFVTRDQHSKMKSSYFVSCPSLVNVTVRLPEKNELARYDETAQLVHPDSLHHLIWICLNRHPLHTFRCPVFEGLKYSVRNLNNCAAESLSVLDVEAFLYCATITSQAQLEDAKHHIYYNGEKPGVLPVAVTDQLGTLNQAKWLTAAYKMYRNEYGADMNDLRLCLIRGLEVVRCVGHHGLDVKLLLALANIFTERTRNSTKHSEVEFNEARAELYWKTALPILEKLQKNQAVTYGTNRLFEYKSKEMSPGEIQAYMDEGKLFNAVQLMKRKEYEKALQLFDALKSPHASFYQAQIYKSMADEQVDQNKENVTSEMRSQHIILLSRSRDCLYLTLDRLRDPLVDRKHPLNAQLGTEIEKIERLLSRIDPDMPTNHRNECDGMSDESVSSTGSAGDHVNVTNLYSSPFMHSTSLYPPLGSLLTPQANRYRLDLPVTPTATRKEARPSPERLDAQIRQMQASRDATIAQIMEQNRMVMDSHRSLVEELRPIQDLTSTMDQLKNMMTGFVNDFRDVVDLVNGLKKEVAELKKDAGKSKLGTTGQLNEEDLYALDEEYGGDYGLNSNLPGFPAAAAAAAGLYPNYQGRLQTANTLAAAAAVAAYPPPALYPSLYPMYTYPGLGLPPQAFGQDAQLNDFRTLGSLPQAATYAAAAAATAMGQTGLPQPKSPWDLNQLSLVQPGLTIPTAPIQPMSLFRDVNMTSSSVVVPLPPSPAFTTLTNASFSLVSSSAYSPSPIVSSVVSSKPAPPVNVVITSSDPLPKTTVQTTQVLSVTIPPQHLKGNLPPKTQPHNYQIPLPTANLATVTATPAIINQPPLVVSTQGLLSSVAPPVYSAIDKSPSGKNAGLGLQIEKSLSQSFGNNDSISKGDKSNISSISLDEHDPRPDFKPIIPLPDEVPVNTGEENEEVLFCERAKLYRFVNKEWKERGVGSLKILRDRNTGKIRILMRRDQVHKICANHFLTKDMTLSLMSNNARAYIWAANDFSDEEMVLEKLCVRFKSEEEANGFSVAFERAKATLPAVQDEADASPPTVSTAAAATTVTTSMGGFIFTTTPTFKPKDHSTPPHIATSPQSETCKTSPFASFTFGVKATSVAVPTNLFGTNTPVTSSPAPLASPVTPRDDFEPTIDFKPVVPLPELVEVRTGEENAEILFESHAKLLRFAPETKEWKERGVGIMKILKEKNVRLVMRREQVLKVCCNHQLLKATQFKRMGDNSKAFTWYAQDYEDGELKSQVFAIRFKSEEQAEAFRRAVTSAQDLLDENNALKATDGMVAIPEIKATESGSSGSEDTAHKSKVKSKPITDPPLKLSVTASTTTAAAGGWGDKFKPKLGSWKCKNCYIVNEAKDHRCVACETPRPNLTPKKTPEPGGNNASQFSFGPPVTTSPSQFSFGIPATTTVANSTTTGFVFAQNATSSWGDAFKPKQGSWECTQCLVRNEPDVLHCISCMNPKDPTVPPKKKEDPKGVNLETPGLKFTFGIPATVAKTIETSIVTSTTTVPPTASSSWGDAFKPKQGSWECNACLVRNDPDKLYCVSCDGPKDSTVPKKEPKDKGVTPGLEFSFGIPATTSGSPFSFTFGSIPKTITTAAVASTKPFSFTTATETKTTSSNNSEESKDQFVFGSPQKHTFEFTPRSPRRRSSSGGGQGDEDDSYTEDEGDHIYFKPVIPLPDKIDVKTGEEQEEVLYCHRAKLFRFVNGEWKERGIGDLKILRNTGSGKLRVLMRRDQVLKICLNHALTSNIEYFPKDDKTWHFSAPDFSEGEINHWQFCVRFKSADLAREFKKAVDDALTKSNDEEKQHQTKDTDVIFVSEMTVTPEEEQEAMRLKLPPKFMAYRQLPYCTCDTCKKDDLILSEILERAPSATSTVISSSTTPVVTSTMKQSLFGAGDSGGSQFVFGSRTQFKTPSNIFGGSSLSGDTTTTSAPTQQTDSLKDILAKPSVLANIANTTKSVPKDKPTSLFGNLEPPSTSTISNAFNTFSFSLTPTATATSGEGFSLQNPVKSEPSSIFGLSAASPAPLVSSIFSGTTTPTGSLFGSPFSMTKPFSSASSIFGGGSGGTTPTTAAVTPTEKTIFPSFPTPTTVGSTFTPGELTEKTTAATNIFGTTPVATKNDNSGTSIFGGSATTGLTFGSFTVKEDLNKPLKKEDNDGDDGVVLKCDSNLSFASLAAAKPDTKLFTTPKTNDDVKPFAFLGSGTPVFASLAPKPTKPSISEKKKNKSGDEDAEESVEADTAAAAATTEEYDPHYEPIVPLPDAVVVSTGEEEETVIFNERAKLFRFDNNTKEWKERGIGQLKILHHPVNGTYRLLLRREQIHKVALNMLITSNFEIQPMKLSDKAWLWCGYNYSEDTSELEKLAAQFKHVELAQKFHAAIQESIENVKRLQETKSNLPSTIQNFGTADTSEENVREPIVEVIEETQQDDDEDDDDDDDDDDEDNDDDRTVMFMKRCTLSEQQENGSWKNVGLGELQVYYDPDIYGSRIFITDDSGLVLSNTIIGINTEMMVDDVNCMWKAVEWHEEPPRWRSLKAMFENQTAAEEFHCNYLESVQFAHESDLVDGILAENPDTDDD